jgi:hypothetical protein
VEYMTKYGLMGFPLQRMMQKMNVGPENYEIRKIHGFNRIAYKGCGIYEE